MIVPIVVTPISTFLSLMGPSPYLWPGLRRDSRAMQRRAPLAGWQGLQLARRCLARVWRRRLALAVVYYRLAALLAALLDAFRPAALLRRGVISPNEVQCARAVGCPAPPRLASKYLLGVLLGARCERDDGEEDASRALCCVWRGGRKAFWSAFPRGRQRPARGPMRVAGTLSLYERAARFGYF